jgi:hypothetical protein
MRLESRANSRHRPGDRAIGDDRCELGRDGTKQLTKINAGAGAGIDRHNAARRAVEIFDNLLEHRGIVDNGAGHTAIALVHRTEHLPGNNLAKTRDGIERRAQLMDQLAHRIAARRVDG